MFSNNNSHPLLTNLHLNHLQEDCPQQQEHKLINNPHHQPMESGMALHPKSSLGDQGKSDKFL